MSKYKIGDVFVPNETLMFARTFDRAEVVAFTPGGSAILKIAVPVETGRFLLDDLVGRSDYTLDTYYVLVKPKPAFFEVGKFYRFGGVEIGLWAGYTRYEIKEIFETPQDGGSVFLQAHAEGVSGVEVAQVFLDEGDFDRMIKM